MIVILSPSKTLDFSDTSAAVAQNIAHTTPDLLKEASALAKILKKKQVDELAALMSLSDKLAALNYGRYQNFSPPFTPQNARQALLAFKGDVYTDIAVGTYRKEDFDFAQGHVRILSGLYGLLRPLDLIQPYRLEMGTKLSTSKGNSLYEYWGEKITKQLNQDFQEHPQKTLINLASQEYFKAVNAKKLSAEIITPVFKQYKNGNYKVIALFAKKARGTMTNFIIQNKIEEAEKLKTFSEAGYEYDENKSAASEWVFVR